MCDLMRRTCRAKSAPPSARRIAMRASCCNVSDPESKWSIRDCSSLRAAMLFSSCEWDRRDRVAKRFASRARKLPVCSSRSPYPSARSWSAAMARTQWRRVIRAWGGFSPPPPNKIEPSQKIMIHSVLTMSKPPRGGASLWLGGGA